MREMTLGDRLKRANWLLLGLALLLAVLGVVCVRVAAVGKPVDYGWQQLRWVVVGVAACLLTLAVPYMRLVRLRYLLYALGLLLLLAVLVIGVGGASSSSVQRWIRIGGFKAQPSEFMKVIMVIVLAGYIRYETRYRRFRGLAFPFALTLVPVLLIMRQPDLCTALLLLP